MAQINLACEGEDHLYLEVSPERQNEIFLFHKIENYGQEVPSAGPHDPVADCPEERDVPALNVQTKTLFVSLDQS